MDEYDNYMDEFHYNMGEHFDIRNNIDGYHDWYNIDGYSDWYNIDGYYDWNNFDRYHNRSPNDNLRGNYNSI